MTSITSAPSRAISSAALREALDDPRPPLVIDVRRRPAFVEARHTIAGALRRPPDDVAGWAASLPAADTFVVYCVHGHEVSQNVATALRERGLNARYLEGGIAAWHTAEGACDAKPGSASTRWVTRERPKIDRIACPWLIARFVDPDAEFLYVPTDQVLETARTSDAIPYDVPSVHFSHVGDACSFDAFVKHYRLQDPALAELAVIVRGADTGRLDIAAQAAGLAAISLGLSRNFKDDHAMLRQGMVMYDALYAWCRDGKDEFHTWNPNLALTAAH